MSQVLHVLARHLRLADDASLEHVAHATEGFSPADLQALLGDAQLAAVHRTLDAAEVADRTLGKGPQQRAEQGVEEVEEVEEAALPVVSSDELLSAMAAAKPSVSACEVARLDAIYADFLSTRTPAASSQAAQPKRATLA
jgi:SpoVK/Ycf46/Vps4 family AAA+-type ATPase